jgi:hypothetical protein
MLSDEDKVPFNDALKFFSLDHLLIDGEANQSLLNHLEYVAHNTNGRFIAEEDSQVIALHSMAPPPSELCI